MTRFILLYFLLFQNAIAEDLFKKIQANSELSPYINKIMLTHLQSSSVEPQQAYQILLSMNSINDNIGKLDRINTLALIITESFKSVLNHPSERVKGTNIIAAQLAQMKQKKEKYHLVYSDFSKFIIDSVIDEFTPYLKDQFLDKNQNIVASSLQEKEKLFKLKKVIKYLGPWVNKVNSLPANEFNFYVNQVIAKFYQKVDRILKVIQFHSINAESQGKRLFDGLNQPEIIKFLAMPPRKSSESESLSAEAPDTSSEQVKSQAQKTVEDLTPPKKDIPTQELDQLIESIKTN